MLPRGRKSPVATRASSVVPIFVPEVQQESARSPTTPPPLPFPKHPAPVNEPVRPPHLTIVRTPVTPTPTPTPLPLPRKVDEPKDPRSMIGAVILVILTVVVTTVILAWQRGFISMARQKVQFALNEHQRKLIEDGEQDRAAKVAAEQKAEAERTAKVAAEAEAKKNGDSYVAERDMRLSLEQQLAQAMKDKAKVEAELASEREAHAKVLAEITTLRDLLSRNKANRRLKISATRIAALEAEKSELEKKLEAAIAREGASGRNVAGLQKAAKTAKVEVDTLKGALFARDQQITKLQSEKTSLARERDQFQRDLVVARKQLEESSSNFDWKKIPRAKRFYIWAALQIGLGESTWNYSTVGPPVTVEFWDKTKKKKISKVYRAYGFYQVLEPNIRPWSKQFCGVELTPRQFLHNDDCQDLVAFGEMPRIWDQCKGNEVRKAACLSRQWFGGPNVSLDASDGQTSVMEYITNFLTKSPLKRVAKLIKK